MSIQTRSRSRARYSSEKQPVQEEPPRASSSANDKERLKLRRSPNEEHEPENYEDLPLDFTPILFSSLERYLPDQLLNSTRIDKASFMTGILQRYSPHAERVRIPRFKEYRERILSSYQRLHEEIYSLDPASIFAPSFLTAFNDKSEQTFRNMMVESFPGIFTFELFKPQFCEMLMAEVEHMEKWVYDSRTTIMRPNTMNNFGVVLDDFGFDSMLQQLVDDFISPIAQVLFPELCGSSLDSHHGYIVEYGKDRDVDLGFHVDDSEVSLNVCLGKQFTGGELYFHGVRCDNHVDSSGTKKEFYKYSHVPGHAILHSGRHRHGAKPTTSGNRVNLVLWCRSSIFREIKNYHKDFSSWCGGCKLEKQRRHRDLIDDTTIEILARIAAGEALTEMATKSWAG